MQEKRHNRRVQKGLAALMMTVALLCCAVNGSWAWLTDRTATLTNGFAPADVTCQVTEEFENNIKTNVRVQNTGTVPGYIRAVLVINWADGDGNLHATPPVSGTDYTLSLNETDWFALGGYYYCKAPVDAGKWTPELIQTCQVEPKAAPPEGYHLQVSILAEAIQADGHSGESAAVELAWPVTITDSAALTAAQG